MRTLLSVLALSLVTSTFAWDASGHEVVAQIAWNNLTKHAQTKYAKLLKSALPALNDARNRYHMDYSNFIVAARWADDIVDPVLGYNPYEQPNYRVWHYIDLEKNDFSSLQLPLTAAQQHNTVLEGILDAEKRIKGKSAPGFTKNKTEALMFLLHYVGDANQPLHAADDNDQGGHFPITLPNGSAAVAHKLWDGEVTSAYKLTASNFAGIQHAATDLDSQFAASLTPAEVNSTPDVWAMEGYDYAIMNIYPYNGQTVPAGVLDGWQTDALRRVDLAGHRLAHILNDLAG